MPEDHPQYAVPPTADKIAARIRELRGEREKIDQRIRELSQQLAEMSTEFKVGERVIYCGDEFELSAIRPEFNPRNPDLYGRKIKRDGTPSIAERRLYGGHKMLTRALQFGIPDPAGKAPGER